MSRFKGKNNYKKLGDQFIFKNSFFADAHNLKGPEVFDFDFIEYQLYGAIDLRGSSILPNDNFIVNLAAPDSMQAFDFVGRMFSDVRTNIRMALYLGELLTENEFLINMEAKRAYEPPKKIYSTYLANILINYNNFLEAKITLLNNITSFGQYVKEFMVFLKTFYEKYPITFTGWTQSSNNSLFSTGLAISIADIPFDDDDKKYEEFMNSSAFNYYKKVCLNRGFRVNQHIPYMMVADLTSPAIAPYINSLSIENLLDKYYDQCYDLDYIILRKYIVDYYNILVERNPYKTDLDVCSGKTLKNTFVRELRRWDLYTNTTFDDYFWINYYLDIRNIELGYVKGPSEIKKIKRYLKNMKNSLDKPQLVRYIDNNFRLETFNKPFGNYDVLRRRQRAKEEERRREGITGGSTIAGGSSGGY